MGGGYIKGGAHQSVLVYLVAEMIDEASSLDLFRPYSHICAVGMDIIQARPARTRAGARLHETGILAARNAHVSTPLLHSPLMSTWNAQVPCFDRAVV